MLKNVIPSSIPLIYDDYLMLDEQHVIADKGGKVGLIDYNNNVIIPFEYDGLSFDLFFN